MAVWKSFLLIAAALMIALYAWCVLSTPPLVAADCGTAGLFDTKASAAQNFGFWVLRWSVTAAVLAAALGFVALHMQLLHTRFGRWAARVDLLGTSVIGLVAGLVLLDRQSNWVGRNQESCLFQALSDPQTSSFAAFSTRWLELPLGWYGGAVVDLAVAVTLATFLGYVAYLAVRTTGR